MTAGDVSTVVLPVCVPIVPGAPGAYEVLVHAESSLGTYWSDLAVLEGTVGSPGARVASLSGLPVAPLVYCVAG